VKRERSAGCFGYEHGDQPGRGVEPYKQASGVRALSLGDSERREPHDAQLIGCSTHPVDVAVGFRTAHRQWLAIFSLDLAREVVRRGFRQHRRHRGDAQSKRFACVAYDVAGNPAASMTRRYVEPISTRCDWRRRQSPTVTSDGLICMFTTFRGDGACRRRVRRSNRRAWRTLRLRISSLSEYLQVSPAGWKRCRLRGFR
jgi:hypothetical protein